MDSLSSLWQSFSSVFVNALPRSPFRQFLNSFADVPYLGWLNWFIPVGALLKIFSAWLVAVGLYYLYSIILRWIKVIGD